MSLLDTINFITSHPLSREHKISSIIRYLKWQIWSRLVQGPIIYDWVNGSKFLVKTGDTGLTGNIYTGLHEFPEMSFLLHYLRVDDLFVDVGANVGSYTILASSVVGAKCIAFEPVPTTYKMLIENMRLNHLDTRVKCINKAVGYQQGSLAFTSDYNTENHALASGEVHDNTIIVEMTSLDATLYGECPALIKIDVEGFETPVLEGAMDTLKRTSLHCGIIELNGSGSRYGYDESRIIELMYDHGFKTYLYEPFDRSLTALDGKNLQSGNTLFIRDKLFTSERLRTAPMVSILGRQF